MGKKWSTKLKESPFDKKGWKEPGKWQLGYQRLFRYRMERAWDRWSCGDRTQRVSPDHRLWISDCMDKVIRSKDWVSLSGVFQLQDCLRIRTGEGKLRTQACLKKEKPLLKVFFLEFELSVVYDECFVYAFIDEISL